MKTLIERYEEKLATFDHPPRPGAAIVVYVDDLRALIAAHKALREAAGALLEGLVQRLSESWIYECEYRREPGYHDVCEVIGTRRAQHNGDVVCDACARFAVKNESYIVESDFRDQPHAAPLRALRAALKEEP